MGDLYGDSMYSQDGFWPDGQVVSSIQSDYGSYYSLDRGPSVTAGLIGVKTESRLSFKSGDVTIQEQVYVEGIGAADITV